MQVLLQGEKYARDAEDLTNVHFFLGMAYDGLKQHDRAIEAYLKAIEDRKDNLEARLQLGLAYAAKGDKANARKYLDEFLKQGGAGDLFMIQGANDRLMKMAAE